MAKLSAFLITKNESADIAACLQSLGGIADEIVVVDDFSTDGTPEICQGLGARVLTRRFDGFAAQKQFALDQTAGTWALSLDADERLTPAGVAEIRVLMNSNAAHAGYEVRRNFYFLGKHLRFGGLGADWVLRLFRKDQGRFRNVKVHEGIEVGGTVGRLRQPLEHFSYPTIEEYVAKCNHYTTLAAEEQWLRGRRFSWLDHLRPAWELGSRIVLKGAWLDGPAGLKYAALSAHAAWLRSIKLKEIEKNPPLPPTPPTPQKGQKEFEVIHP
jgi:glycosyltransferase involved in cell wall biosynthesis